LPQIIVPYRLYAQSVRGIKVDISDTEAAYASIVGYKPPSAQII